MTQGEKECLLKYLCAILPCGVICSIYRIDDEGVGWRDSKCNGFYKNKGVYEFYFDDIISVDDISYIKPYLRPMSSMTEEERKEYRKVYEKDFAILEDSLDAPISYTYSDGAVVRDKPLFNVIDWFNDHLLDYRDLIGKGLALEAQEGMYNSFNNF